MRADGTAYHVPQLSRVCSELRDATVMRLSDVNSIFSQLFNGVTVILEGCRLLIKFGFDIALDRSRKIYRLCPPERYFHDI